MASGWGSHNPAQARVIAGETTLTRVEAEHQVRLLVLLRPRPGGARDSRGLGLAEQAVDCLQEVRTLISLVR
jgi:hypothetical protein